MNTANDELIDQLAQRYVVGTMRGRARRRFEAYAGHSFAARDAIWKWEAHFAPLAWSLPPVPPSELTWPRIRAALRRRARESQSGRPWAAIAAMFALLAVIGGGGWWQALQQPPVTVTETIIERVAEPVTVAIVDNPEGDPLWLLALRPDSGQLTLEVINEPESQPGKDYQLWLLAADGTPLSLGLLPSQGSRTLSLPASASAALPTSQIVAVSLEPAGGSPQPVPTGPVLFTAMLFQP